MSLFKTVVGIDPGRSGGIAAIGLRTGLPRVFAMPESDDRGVNVEGVLDILSNITAVDTLAYLEWPSGRPGESPEFAFRFGLQCGALDASLKAKGFSTRHVSPNKWTGYLKVPGKTHTDAIPIRASVWDKAYPAFTHLIRGPRGGIRDGLLDALLIAHWGRLGESGVGHKGGRRQPALTLE